MLRLLLLTFHEMFQADASFSAAVIGMKPDKEKHQFFFDVEPQLGFPLAIRPRFQLNLVLFRVPDVTQLSKMVEEIVMPLVWIEGGFGEPSEEMVKAIKYHLADPDYLLMLSSIVCFGIGALLLLVALVYFVWSKNISCVKTVTCTY